MQNTLLRKSSAVLLLYLSAVRFLERSVPEATFKGNSGTADETAERLIGSYGNSVLRLSYFYMHNQDDAEDVLQETLIRYFSSAPVFEGNEHEKAWLLRVAANICKNMLRHNKTIKTDELDEQLIADNRQDLSFVWEAVRQLPVEYGEIIHLYYYEGYSLEETARILEKNQSTVRSEIRRARIRLQKILGEAYDFEC